MAGQINTTAIPWFAGLPQNKDVFQVSMSAPEIARKMADKVLTVYVDINTKTYEIQRPIDESYERERGRRIIPMDSLPKWNYLVKRS